MNPTTPLDSPIGNPAATANIGGPDPIVAPALSAQLRKSQFGNGHGDGSPATAVTRFHAELDAIAVRRSSDRECREAILACVARHRNCVGGAWHWVSGEHSQRLESRLIGSLADREDVHQWMQEVAAKAYREQSEVVSSSLLVRNLTVICIPSFLNNRHDQGGDSGAWTFTLLYADNERRQDRIEDLLAGQCALQTWQRWFVTERRHEAEERLLATSALLELTNHLTTTDQSFDAASQYTASSLQQYFQSRLTAIAIASRSGKTVQLSSIAGLGVLDRKSTQTQQLEAALNESVLRDRMTKYPAVDRADTAQLVAHKRLAESIGAESILSLPLKQSDGKLVGAVLLAGSPRQLMSRQTQLKWESFRQPIAQSLGAVRQREQEFARRLRRTAQGWIAGKRPAIIAVLLLGMLGLALFPVPYRVRCQGRIEPMTKRFCLAPFDGLLETTLVKPGDSVSQGEVIAKMDGREIQWELAGLTAESARALREFEARMAQQEVAKAILAELEAKKLATRTELLHYRREHLEIKSPITGIVLSGSLDDRRNEPIKLGQALYEVAPIDRLRLEIAVPAIELSKVVIGQSVEAKVHGITDTVLTGSIVRIRPQSETRNQQNVFIADLEFDNPAGRFRPGMEGVVAITTDSHPLIWNLGHRVWEKLCTWVWW